MSLIDDLEKALAEGGLVPCDDSSDDDGRDTTATPPTTVEEFMVELHRHHNAVVTPITMAMAIEGFFILRPLIEEDGVEAILMEQLTNLALSLGPVWWAEHAEALQELIVTPHAHEWVLWFWNYTRSN